MSGTLVRSPLAHCRAFPLFEKLSELIPETSSAAKYPFETIAYVTIPPQDSMLEGESSPLMRMWTLTDLISSLLSPWQLATSSGSILFVSLLGMA